MLELSAGIAYKDALDIDREREASLITFAHVPRCRVLAVKYSVYAPKNCITLAVKCGVNTLDCIVLKVKCSV